MATKFEFEVAMTCEGCSGALNRILDRQKGKGVDEHVVDLNTKRVTVTSSTLGKDEVQAILEKCGKEVVYVGST